MSKRKSNAQGGSAAKPEAGTGPEQEAPVAEIVGGMENQTAAGTEEATPLHGSRDGDTRGGDAAAAADTGSSEGVNDENAEQAETEAGSGPGATDPADAVQSEPASQVEVGAEQAAVSDDAGAPGAEAGANPVAPDGGPDTDGAPGSPGPNPDSIATTAMLAAGAAYYRAMRLGEDVQDGIDLEWLMPDRAEERIVDRSFVERSVIYLAEFCRKVKGASTGTLVMHMKLGRYRSSGETTPEQDVAFGIFAQTLQQLDRLAEIRAAEARQKHKKIAKPVAIDIEETTLALVDEPMALTEIGLRQGR